MAHDPQQVMVLAWFSQEQWKLLKRRATDAQLLDNTYEEWLEEMNRLERRLKLEGNSLVKYSIDIAELELWCQTKNVALDSQARSQYVAEMASKKRLQPE